MSLSMTSLTENICMFAIVFPIQVKGVGYVDCKLGCGYICDVSLHVRSDTA